ncbi:MAG: hypothetical protein D6729_05230 [Deltaproteobacteria bacterium]|nr:MAG: hypothetical protein D6729_05230 [Deltaproteobacteria bacterium]
MRTALENRALRLGGRIASAALALLLFSPADAQEIPVGPRPARGVDLNPRNVFHLSTEFGTLEGMSGLAFPLGIDYQVDPAIAFMVELPFGYATAPGEPAAPLFGQVGVGARGSAYVPLGVRAGLRYGGALMGRIPTAPAVGPGSDLDQRFGVLRTISSYDFERWTPGLAAVRLDAAAALDLGRIAFDAELGPTILLPLDAAPATVSFHGSLLLAVRAFKGIWGFVELAGSQGLSSAGESEGAMLSLAPGMRLRLGGAAPALWVSLPLWGGIGGRAPVVIFLEIASY